MLGLTLIYDNKGAPGFPQCTIVVITIHTDISGPVYEQGLTLIPACISIYMPMESLDEITYPFLNFNGCTVEV